MGKLFYNTQKNHRPYGLSKNKNHTEYSGTE
jgi:hypothetical protein